MAGTAYAVPACHRRFSKFLVARLMARGQSHDAHALDRAHLEKARHFPIKVGGNGVLCPAPVNPPEGQQVAADQALA